MEQKDINEIVRIVTENVASHLREVQEAWHKKIVAIDTEDISMLRCKKYDANIWENVVMVKPLSAKYYPYKSLILDQQGNFYTSLETSNLIMKKIFMQIGVTYQENCALIKKMALSYNYKLPYVAKGKVYLQEQGNAKQSTTWYAIHLLKSYEYTSEQSIVLEFKNIKIATDFSKESFQNQLMRIKHISHVYRHCLKHFEQVVYGSHYDAQNYLANEIDKIDISVNQEAIKNVIAYIFKSDE